MPLPDTMRAAVYREKSCIGVEERPLPELGPHDALLREWFRLSASHEG